MWKKICQGIRKSARSNSASVKITSCNLNFIGKPMIMNDLELLVVFHCALLFPHFKYLQGSNQCTGNTPSFLCRHITVRYFLIMEDIEGMKNEKWNNHEMFVDFKVTYKLLNDEKKQIKKKNYLVYKIRL